MKTYTVTGVRKIKDQLAWRIDVVDVATGEKAQVQITRTDALEVGVAMGTSLYNRDSRIKNKRARDEVKLLEVRESNGVVPKAFENWLRLEGEVE